MDKWRGRATMLNSLAWFFHTKLNDQPNALRCIEEVSEIMKNLEDNQN
jgi:hypothetical protein